MPQNIVIDPVSRIEGHLKIEVTVDTVNSVQQVISAKSTGTMFRGFEQILQGRAPQDAIQITQRICGVCPISHGMAASKTLDDAFGGGAIPSNGRILRNLVLGANFIQSHILHLYHLAALDYIDVSQSTLPVSSIGPWDPDYATPDMIKDTSTVDTLVGHYIEALNMRRYAHQMGAVFGGRMPASPVFVPGGITEAVTQDKINTFRGLLTTLRNFIDSTMVSDTQAIASIFNSYYSIGSGCRNLMAFGVFDLDSSGNSKLFARGHYQNGTHSGTVNTDLITEHVLYSKYSSASQLTPSAGETQPDDTKSGAYSWIKAPRYENTVYETGPLARMWVNGDYTNGISVMDRIAARTQECKKIADAMDLWLDELAVGESGYEAKTVPSKATGVGLTEAPRGALGHWLSINRGTIDRYQVITPTNWNASPKDDNHQSGPIEQALVGTPVNDTAKPIEVLRVIHSYDPCLSCSVHFVRPDKKEAEKVIDLFPTL